MLNNYLKENMSKSFKTLCSFPTTKTKDSKNIFLNTKACSNVKIQIELNKEKIKLKDLSSTYTCISIITETNKTIYIKITSKCKLFKKIKILESIFAKPIDPLITVNDILMNTKVIA